jgi:DNA-binding beta-propeller fold protein YncE
MILRSFLMTLGTSGQPSDTGATSIDYRTIRYAGRPFYFPTNAAIGLKGEIFVTDGYGNARVHKFSADGELLLSWGEPGSNPGQFRVPHGIAIDRRGILFIADRENRRIQVFSPDGEFLEEWPNIARPCQIAFDRDGNVYVAELGYKAGMWPGTVAPSDDATGGRVSVFDPQGQLLARWGGGQNPTAPGDFFAPHDIRVDSHGDALNGRQCDVVAAIRDLTEGNGADVVFECAGGRPKQGMAGTETVRQAIDAVRSGGKVIGVSWFGALW